MGGKKRLQEILNVNEGAKVDRMAAHIKASEKKAGKGEKEAETIAWKTLNKRGYLNNKNKMEEELAMPMLEDGKKNKKKLKNQSQDQTAQ